jgi:hypothetical protein
LDDVEPASEQGCDVLHEHVAGSKNANSVGDASPEAGLVAVDAFAFARVGDVLVTPSSG